MIWIDQATKFTPIVHTGATEIAVLYTGFRVAVFLNHNRQESTSWKS